MYAPAHLSEGWVSLCEARSEGILLLNSQFSILHGRWRIRLLGREAGEPARRRRSRLDLEPKGGRERIKDGAQWCCAAVVPGTGLWVVGCGCLSAGGDGIAVSEVVYCTTMDRKKKSVELKPWAIDSRAQGKFRPWGFLGRGGGPGGPGGEVSNLVSGCPTRPKAQPPEREREGAAAAAAATHTHNRHAHAICTTHSCCVSRSCRSCRVVSIGREGRECSSTDHGRPE